MERRSFLKLCCAAVVAPSLPLPKEKELTEDDLLSYIARRREAAVLAMVNDLGASALLFNSGPKGLEWQCINFPIRAHNDIVDAKRYCLAEWTSWSVPINYKQ